MRLIDIVDASQRVAATPKRSEKVREFADLLSVLSVDEVVTAIGLMIGQPRQGRIGVGWASLAALRDRGAAAEATLTLAEVDTALTDIAGAQGPGSQRDRGAILTDLFGRATEAEQLHLFRVLTGEMRQGANEGIVTDAVAKASGRPIAAVRRAAMLLGDLGAAASLTLSGADLDEVGLRPLVGVQPMLAATAGSVAEALELTGAASVEVKLDGARVQVHRVGSDVRIYTRSLREIGERLPEIVAVVTTFPSDEFVLDGEALGLDEDGNPLKFQDSMNVSTSLRAFFFDVLHADGISLIDVPLSERKAVLRRVVPSHHLLDTIDTADPSEAAAFAQAALAAGHEGVMVKALDSTYQAGRRGATWRKVKPVHTLDLVVLGAEWGHGRRAGWLSNLHLGARAADGTFVMVGKTFKGMTDELLRWQTATFPALAVDPGSTSHELMLRPEVVVEIAIDGVQRSRRYPGGVALRFARVRRYRPDKRADEADTIETVQSFL